MKLRNKKTGEIKEFALFDGNELQGGATLESLTKDWEDYEEPKPQVVYYIDRDGEIVSYKNVEYPKRVFNTEQNKEIGNYFKTKEEAEKAVEKLKAWKRLKDKGFRFVGWCDSVSDNNPDMALFKLNDDAWEIDTCDDLDLLFSREDG